MDRKAELKILIASLVSELHTLYEGVYYKHVDNYLNQHSKAKTLHQQIDKYIIEYNSLK